MNNVIIGTAGHVDHGKTCLIKALSGYDTDRLKEEKKRGITIENGFANLPNDKGYHLGIIDVPGHEKFVKNMLAGIGGIDIVLLVVSLEEGIKPQTIEHFEILKTLGIKKGIVVFTKIDSEKQVDFENLKSQVKDLCKGSFLENAKMIPVSSMTGKNIDVLKNEIFALVSELTEKNNNKELARLPIDRVFTMEGFGTVITGTLMEGKIDTGDELMVYPSQRIVKVRQIESHGKIEPSAFAGQRTAINLLNVKKEDIKRGDVLAKKSSIIPSDMIDCKLMMFKSSPRRIKNGEKLHFNYGSKQTEATVRIFNDQYVQFRFNEPIPVKRGDKYVIRFLSPETTCGGGIIINVNAKKLSAIDENSIKHFALVDSSDIKEVLMEIINVSSIEFPSVETLSKKINLSIEDTYKICEELVNKKLANCISLKKPNENEVKISDNIYIGNRFFDGIKKYIYDILSKFHKDNALSKGMKKEELKSLLFKRYNKTGDTALEKLINYLVEIKVLKQINDLVANFDFNVVIDDKKSSEIGKVEKRYLDAGFELPLTQDVVNDYAKGKPNQAKLECRQVLVDLAKEGKLVKLSNEYYIHKNHYDKAYNAMMEFFKTHDKMKMAELRDLVGTSRKYAILLMEYFDSKRITKMVGECRVLYK